MNAVKIFKGTVQPAITEVLNTEIDENMLAFFINFIISCHGRSGGEITENLMRYPAGVFFILCSRVN